MSKIFDSLQLIRNAASLARRPAAMLSFGKDSMVMAHLMREADYTPKFPKAHAFPMDVIYHRDPWFAHKHVFADSVIRSWGMEVYDFPPMHAGVKTKEDMIELVARYTFGSGAMDIPKNICKPDEYPRRDYICGLNDWLMRPKTFLLDYEWDCVFMGHRNADVDPFEGHVPLSSSEAEVGGVKLVFPLKDWSDNEVWDYIEENHIAVQGTRYKDRKEIADKWHNNDYMHACTACIDPRETRPTVYCPKLKGDVKNRGKEVLQFNVRPHYWQEA